jgi:hypothetical protein
MGAARAINDPCVAKAANDLFQICARKIFRLCNVCQRNRIPVIHSRKRHHEAHAVLAARAERNRATPV